MLCKQPLTPPSPTPTKNNNADIGKKANEALKVSKLL
jgi:hypothetical protein